MSAFSKFLKTICYQGDGRKCVWMILHVRPEFGDQLAIKRCRHPVLDKITRGNSQANDVFASSDSSLAIVTGPNMAGKTTYLKMIGQVQILGQMGCFVPAETARIRLADHILSRLDTNDDQKNNTSSFTLEMKDMNYIFQNITNRSLVLMDELGRNTMSEAGYAVCHACCEELLKSQAFVFLATHFLDLTLLDGTYKGVENYHFRNCEENDSTDHTVRRGPYGGKSYGIDIARKAGWPKSMVARAEEIATGIAQSNRESEDDISALRSGAKFKLVNQLADALRDCDVQSPGPDLRNHLKQIQRAYLAKVDVAGD